MAEIAPERRSAWTFASLMLGHSAQGLTFTAFVAGLAGLGRDMGTGGSGAMTAQLTVTVASAGVILGALVSGWIVERLGARRTMIFALSVFGLAGAAGMAAHREAVLLGSRVLVGFAAACMVTACIAEIAASREGNARARAIGASTAFGSATALIGLNLGGVLAQWGGWRLAFVQYPVFALAGLRIVFVGLKTEVHAPASPDPVSKGSGAWRLWPFYLFTVMLTATMFMGTAQFAFLLPQDGVRQPTAISLVMSGTTATGVVVSFCFGFIERRLGMQGALVAGLGAMAAGLALIGGVATPAAALVGAVLLGVFVGIVMPYIHHAVAQKASPAARPRAIGLLTAFTFAGAFLNPFMAAPISARFGLHGLFLWAAALMSVFALGAITRGLWPARMIASEVAAP